MTNPTEHNRAQWLRKPALRAVYEDIYVRLSDLCNDGTTLEVGGGSGNLKAYRPDVISSDIAWWPWLDLVADAQRLPIAAGSLDNIVLFDVLHHLEFPMLFLREAARVLRPGGRLVMAEPAITMVSGPFYQRFHREPVMMGVDPFAEGRPCAGRDPFTANQALPTLLFSRFSAKLQARLPELVLRETDWISLFAYPLTGGFNQWSLIPGAWVRPLLRLEDALPCWLRKRLGFRMIVCLEKAASPGDGH